MTDMTASRTGPGLGASAIVVSHSAGGSLPAARCQLKDLSTASAAGASLGGSMPFSTAQTPAQQRPTVHGL